MGNNINPNDIKLEIFRNRSEMEAMITVISTGEIINRIPVSWKARENKLDYLSVSKIGAYEQCPACFYKQYMADETASVDNGNYYTKFGTILHEVVEIIAKTYRDNGIVLNHEAVFNEVWSRHNLNGFDHYEEALQLIKNHYNSKPIDKRPHKPVLVEEEWRGELGGMTFGLILDYAGVMKSNPKFGILMDYKTNRMPFNTAQLQDSLQLRIYEIILRRHLMPEIERWISGYELFFHDWQQCPQRSEDDLKRAEDYVHIIGKQIENDNVWEERLNNYCGYRECRHTCESYQKYAKSIAPGMELIKIDTTDIEAIERQREEFTTYEKIAKGRKEECAELVKQALEEKQKKGEKLIVDGKELSLYANSNTSYRYYDTRNVLLSLGKSDILEDCLSVNQRRFQDKVKADPSLKLSLAGCTSTGYSTPYIVKKSI